MFPICFVCLQILNTFKNHFVYYSNDPSDESFSFSLFFYITTTVILNIKHGEVSNSKVTLTISPP